MTALSRRHLLTAAAAVLPASALLAACGPGKVRGAAPSGQAAGALPLVGLQMAGTTDGWAAGGATVYRTTDGARTFTEVSPPARPTAGAIVLQVLGSSAAWAAMADATGVSVYRTADGGTAWTAAALPSAAGLVPRFLAASSGGSHGWLWSSQGISGAAAGALHATTDGGKTWSLLGTAGTAAGALPTSGGKTGLAFGDARHGVVCGAGSQKGMPWIYATADGGTTWTAAHMPIAAPYHGDVLSLQFPTFFDARHGAVFLFAGSGSVPTAIPYTSADGGASWTAALPIASPHAAPTISYVGAQRWFASDGVGIYATENAGAAWNGFLATPPRVLQGITVLDFVSPSMGFALIPGGLGPRGRAPTALVQTVDAGQSWGPAGS